MIFEMMVIDYIVVHLLDSREAALATLVRLSKIHIRVAVEALILRFVGNYIVVHLFLMNGEGFDPLRLLRIVIRFLKIDEIIVQLILFLHRVVLLKRLLSICLL